MLLLFIYLFIALFKYSIFNVSMLSTILCRFLHIVNKQALAHFEFKVWLKWENFIPINVDLILTCKNSSTRNLGAGENRSTRVQFCGNRIGAPTAALMLFVLNKHRSADVFGRILFIFILLQLLVIYSMWLYYAVKMYLNFVPLRCSLIIIILYSQFMQSHVISLYAFIYCWSAMIIIKTFYLYSPV